MFAGMVLLARDQFRVGDQIGVEDYRGTVTSIQLTTTSLRTFDGRLVLIPNSVMHSQVVTVQTGFQAVRTTVGLDLDDRTDVDRACLIALDVMHRLPQVIDEPPPEAQLAKVGSATVHVELRFWSGARQLETREARHAVIRSVLKAFTEQGIVTGTDMYVVEAGPQLLDALRCARGSTPRSSTPAAPAILPDSPDSPDSPDRTRPETSEPAGP